MTGYTINHGSKINIFNLGDALPHPKRLLEGYFQGCKVENLPLHKAFTSNNSDFVIILLHDSVASIPQEIDHLIPKNLPEDGFYLKTIFQCNRNFLVITSGGLPGLIYAINELGRRYIKLSSSSYVIPELDLIEKPALPYRLTWTWDHSANWYLNQGGMQELGCFNNYMKPPGGFLEDYKRLIDFMSLNRVSAVTIYGFLRDNHGGIEAAKELCLYAKERGVRILAGIGINSYGGIYWEGNHKYNLTNWLKQNPHLRAKFDKPVSFSIPEFPELWFSDSSYTDAACPSKYENFNYHAEAISWLTETFEIGGINFETGDYGICNCLECLKSRKVNSTWSTKDMQLLYPKIFEATKSKRKDLWLVAEMYWDNILSRETIDSQKDLRMFT